MQTVIEADSHERAGSLGGQSDGVQIRRAASTGFFDEDVLSKRDRGSGNGSQHVVRRRDKNGIDILARNGRLPIGAGGRAMLAGQSFGAL
jgi:hypothetical protein